MQQIAIAKKLELDDRIEAMSMNSAFLTVKDHKRSFATNVPDFRVINPGKTDMGKVSKIILEEVVSAYREAIGVNQWRSTSDVLNWFKGLKGKKDLRFLQFDIEKFYPSITKNLLSKAINKA